MEMVLAQSRLGGIGFLDGIEEVNGQADWGCREGRGEGVRFGWWVGDVAK